MKFKRIILKLLVSGIAISLAFFYIAKLFDENRILNKVIERLTATSRIAEVLVTDARFNPQKNKTYTTIKFLEYDTDLKPLVPKYFTFSGNIIQFQSMVIRFDDYYIKKAHPLKGKSAYIFMKAFNLNDKDTEVFEINKINEIPSGYEIRGINSGFQKKLWQKFWGYALNPKEAKRMGIKNAQIEAPGTKFVPGLFYTINLEHDGGIRVDAQPLSPILKGERLDF